MTVKVLEHEGLYTAYRLVVKRRDDGTLHECVKQIDIPMPPPDGDSTLWAMSLTTEQLEVGLQVFYDKWNFGKGNRGDYKIYQKLCLERQRREEQDVDDQILTTVHSSRQPPAPTVTFSSDPNVGIHKQGQELKFATIEITDPNITVRHEGDTITISVDDDS